MHYSGRRRILSPAQSSGSSATAIGGAAFKKGYAEAIAIAARLAPTAAVALIKNGSTRNWRWSKNDGARPVFGYRAGSVIGRVRFCDPTMRVGGMMWEAAR